MFKRNDDEHVQQAKYKNSVLFWHVQSKKSLFNSFVRLLECVESFWRLTELGGSLGRLLECKKSFWRSSEHGESFYR